ncbi:MAG: hypothetical protein ACYC2Y_09965 [Armatimonadota bacterium]
MLFPKSKMGFTSTYRGDKTDEGWLVLEIGNMELEGVSKLYIDLRDVREVAEKKSKAADALSEAMKLLGGPEE